MTVLLKQEGRDGRWLYNAPEGWRPDEVGFTSWSSTRERESLYNGEPARPVVWTDEKDRQTYRYVLTGANWDGTHRALIEAGLVKCGEANRARPTG